MEKTSKVKSVTFDHEWSNSNGQFFDHKIEFENGDKATYTSKSKEQQNFVVGKDVVYDYVQDQKGNWKCKYDAKRQPGAEQYNPNQTGSYTPKPKDPAEQKRIQKQVAYECALSALNLIDLINVQKGHDYTIANKFLVWIEEKGKDNNTQGSIMASKAIREAIKTMGIPPIVGTEKGLVEKILAKADEIFNYFTAV